MKNKKIILYIISILIVVISSNFLSIWITYLITISQGDNDYKKLELNIEDYDIEYYTVYDKSYKVYKINNYYKGDSIDRIKEELEKSAIWTKNKFYEYIMMKFYEKVDRERIEIDREDLYYYHKGLIYAIIDINDAKLYYLENNLLDYHNDYSEILGIKTDNYISRDIYSIKGQEAKNDGINYYVYNFNEEKGKEINEVLSKSKNWRKGKVDNDILDYFKHNSEINFIQNAYYCYEKIYKVNNLYKQDNNKEDKEIGYKVGIYDLDKCILYYYEMIY